MCCQVWGSGPRTAARPPSGRRGAPAARSTTGRSRRPRFGLRELEEEVEPSAEHAEQQRLRMPGDDRCAEGGRGGAAWSASRASRCEPGEGREGRDVAPVSTNRGSPRRPRRRAGTRARSSRCLRKDAQAIDEEAQRHVERHACGSGSRPRSGSRVERGLGRRAGSRRAMRRVPGGSASEAPRERPATESSATTSTVTGSTSSVPCSGESKRLRLVRCRAARRLPAVGRAAREEWSGGEQEGGRAAAEGRIGAPARGGGRGPEVHGSDRRTSSIVGGGSVSLRRRRAWT
jgi:hypothetical protein